MPPPSRSPRRSSYAWSHRRRQPPLPRIRGLSISLCHTTRPSLFFPLPTRRCVAPPPVPRRSLAAPPGARVPVRVRPPTPASPVSAPDSDYMCVFFL